MKKIKVADIAKEVNERGLFITCPFCGQRHSRSKLADSYVKCSFCGNEYHVHLENNKMTVDSDLTAIAEEYYKKLLQVQKEACGSK